MRVPLRSLQTRIVVAFVALICIMQIGALVVVNLTGASSARESLAHELETGANFLARLLDEDAKQLEQGARLIVSNPDVAATMRGGNLRAFSAMVATQGLRTGADLAILTSPDGRILGHVRATYPVGSNLPKRQLLEQAQVRGSTRSVIDIGDVLYRVVVVPILASEPTGWVIMGLRLDDDNARDLNRLMGLEVSFFFRRPASSWMPAGSTLAPGMIGALTQSLNASLHTNGSTPQIVSLNDVDYMTLTIPENSTDGTEVVAVLQRPVAESLKPFRGLQRNLLTVAGFVLALTLLCGLVVARSIVSPVKALALAARAVALRKGEEPSPSVQGDEIGELRIAFDHMRERIADREKKMLEIAYRDDVTLLPNRALFTDRLEQAINLAERSKGSITVVTMDLDRFKEINDSLGHQAGDLVLIAVARRLRKAPRRKSDTIARLGGDEFALLLPETDAVRVLPLLQRLRTSLERTVEIEGRIVEVRASIGVAIYPEHGVDAITLLRHADLAMYTAKRRGTVVEFFDSSLDRSARDRSALTGASQETVGSDELVA